MLRCRDQATCCMYVVLNHQNPMHRPHCDHQCEHTHSQHCIWLPQWHGMIINMSLYIQAEGFSAQILQCRRVHKICITLCYHTFGGKVGLLQCLMDVQMKVERCRTVYDVSHFPATAGKRLLSQSLKGNLNGACDYACKHIRCYTTGCCKCLVNPALQG